MRRFSSVVVLGTLFEISGCSYIAFTSRGATFNKIDVIHWPSFAEASEGVLLRANEHLSPAKRQVRSRAEGVRFELTRPFGLPVFKTGAINRSATPPAMAGGVNAGPRRQRAIAHVLSKPARYHACFQSEQSQPRIFSRRSMSLL